MSRKADYVNNAIYQPFLNGGNSKSSNRREIIANMYVRVLTELSANRFTWKGLPDSVDERFMELTLFWQALCVFYYDDKYDRFLALRAAGSGAVNMYDNPTTFTVYGNQMINKTLTARECVPIWSNYLRVPDWDIVTIYATKLADIDRTIEINLKGMRVPFIIAAGETERQSYMNMWNAIEDGQPALFVTNSVRESIDEKIKLLNLSIDKDLVDRLLTAKSKIWNECMTLLGIDNVNSEKKERLVTDEVSANNGQVYAQRLVNMRARRQAAAQINDMFDLNVSVDWGIADDMSATAAPDDTLPQIG